MPKYYGFVESGLVALYAMENELAQFDELSSGPPALFDVSGNANDAILGATAGLYINNYDGGHVYKPFTEGGDFLTTPHSAAVAITGNMEIITRVTPQHSNAGLIASKYEFSTSDDRQWALWLDLEGNLEMDVGTGASRTPYDASADWPEAIALGGSGTGWLRVVIDFDSSEIRFYSSSEGDIDPSTVTWTQFATGDAALAESAFYDGTGRIMIGGWGGGSWPMPGLVHRFQIKDGIDGPVVLDMNPADADGDSSFVSTNTGETWTVDTSASVEADDPAWSADGITFDGSDDLLAGLPPITEAFAVEDGVYTESPGDYATAGAFSGTLRVYGIYNRTLTAGERDQNEAAANALVSGAVDETDPTVTISQVHGTGEADSVHEAAGYDASTDTLTVSGTASDETALDRVEVRFNAGTWQTATGTTSWSYDFDVSTWPAGEHTIEARAVDAAGNTSALASETVWHSPDGVWGASAGGHLEPLTIEGYTP